MVALFQWRQHGQSSYDRRQSIKSNVSEPNYQTAHRSRVCGCRRRSQGIEKIVDQRPDLIFLDLFIPGIDGFELFKLFRDHPATHSIPIIIHTAVPLDDVTQIRMRRIQPDAFIGFPVEASALVQTIESVAEESSRDKKMGAPKA